MRESRPDAGQWLMEGLVNFQRKRKRRIGTRMKREGIVNEKRVAS